MLIYGEWVEEEVLAPVLHRQYVFTVPKLLRPCFPSFGPYPAHPCATTHQRHRLGELCRIVGHLLTEAYREADPDGQPGFILFVQTFGDLVTFHPHIHALVTDGVFHPNGVFRALPPSPPSCSSSSCAGLESTVRYLGIEVDDALEMAEQTDV
jgi:hypothetical protein